MTLLSESELRQVAEAIERVERSTDAELVTVLAAQADDYHYIPLLWASLIALLLPWCITVLQRLAERPQLLLVQWATFVLALLFRLP